jgi:eukaryotic-like serine/threonine-protein kinase
MDILKKGRRLESPFSDNRYEIVQKLGEGGFGATYIARGISRSGKGHEQVCLKVTEDQDSWHRESYFGELLRGEPRVVQLFESFPLEGRVGGSKTMLYYLVSELASQGPIREFLRLSGNEPWPTNRAKREVIALLKVLNSLHGGGVTHRDLTPMNIFVTDAGILKLGDFGIAGQTLFGKKPQVLAFNPYFVTAGFDGTPLDDVFQMGQLLAALLTGSAESPLKVSDANEKLRCDEKLKTVVRRAIGPKRERYVDAYEMIEALYGGSDTNTNVRSLKAKTVVFTGPLSIRRDDAAILVFQAGGKVGRKVTTRTDVLVVGGRGDYRGGTNKGVKLRTAIKINKKYLNKVALIGESDFRRLTRIRAA